MVEINTDELIAESHALLDGSLNSETDAKTDGETDAVLQEDSLMESDSLNDDSLNGTSDSVGDTYQAVSFVSKSQKKLFPSDLPPPCTMDQDKVCLYIYI